MQFADIIQTLGEELDAILHVDERGVCCVELNDSIRVQIEPGQDHSNILICCKVSQLPPGKFREQALLDYLRANDFENRQYGTFSFLPKKSILFFHERYPTDNFHADELVEFLIHFSERAYEFRKAIDQGRSVPFGALGESEERIDDDKPHKIETGIKT